MRVAEDPRPLQVSKKIIVNFQLGFLQDFNPHVGVMSFLQNFNSHVGVMSFLQDVNPHVGVAVPCDPHKISLGLFIKTICRTHFTALF